MDGSLTQRRKGLEDKIPDIKKTLHMVEFLQSRRVGGLDMHTGRILICQVGRKAESECRG